MCTLRELLISLHNGMYTACEILSSHLGTTLYCVRWRKLIIGRISATVNNTHMGIRKTRNVHPVQLVYLREGCLGALSVTLKQLSGTSTPIMTW